jgi:hypothetical protein
LGVQQIQQMLHKGFFDVQSLLTSLAGEQYEEVIDGPHVRPPGFVPAFHA